MSKSQENIRQNIIAFFSNLYYNYCCKKNLPFKNFFYITPYLIIYTPLEIPGSSPTGYFSFYMLYQTVFTRHSFLQKSICTFPFHFVFISCCFRLDHFCSSVFSILDHKIRPSQNGTLSIKNPPEESKFSLSDSPEAYDNLQYSYKR